MTKRPARKIQNKETIEELVKTQNPQTTTELIQLTKEKTGLTEQEITTLILELENEDKLKFTKPTQPAATRLKTYTKTKDATWYWITTALAVATVIASFTINETAYPLTYIRNILGIIFVLFLPGYAFIKMLFPAKVPLPTSSENLDSIERIALSLGMSLALSPIVGLILNYTPWGIRLAPITLSLLALTVVFATTALIREYQTKTPQQTAQNNPQFGLHI